MDDVVSSFRVSLGFQISFWIKNADDLVLPQLDSLSSSARVQCGSFLRTHIHVNCYYELILFNVFKFLGRL